MKFKIRIKMKVGMRRAGGSLDYELWPLATA